MEDMKLQTEHIAKISTLVVTNYIQAGFGPTSYRLKKI